MGGETAHTPAGNATHRPHRPFCACPWLSKRPVRVCAFAPTRLKASTRSNSCKGVGRDRAGSSAAGEMTHGSGKFQIPAGVAARTKSAMVRGKVCAPFGQLPAERPRASQIHQNQPSTHASSETLSPTALQLAHVFRIVRFSAHFWLLPIPKTFQNLPLAK